MRYFARLLRLSCEPLQHPGINTENRLPQYGPSYLLVHLLRLLVRVALPSALHPDGCILGSFPAMSGPVHTGRLPACQTTKRDRPSVPSGRQLSDDRSLDDPRPDSHGKPPRTKDAIWQQSSRPHGFGLINERGTAFDCPLRRLVSVQKNPEFRTGLPLTHCHTPLLRSPHVRFAPFA